ncbi:DUF599 domain-containing protein [Tabrizicola sp.]|uniref:DUF599 domain-containing protein n=1 Tax=Tabrizicola sp. TaxID=2005166 RepID=UPI00286B3E6B|nr:DUF599 domain-containing protein [Tabrizicola sp.]
MDILAHLGPFAPLDAAAVGFIVVVWLLTGWLTEHPPTQRPSVTVLMEDYRRDWMRAFVTRQPRIFDGTVIESLRQGTAFFASASLIAIGGGLAMIGNVGTVTNLAGALSIEANPAAVPLKILLVVGFLSNALLKFVWSNRLFGYCSILMAAVPNDSTDPLAYHRASQAAEINITAARSFNSGLRSIYFALAALGWLIGPLGLVLATLAAASVLIRREFASRSRVVMLNR